MAIVFEKQRKPVNWFALFSALFIIVFLVFATYFLFFAPSPRIDIVLSPNLERASQISELEFTDPAELLTGSAFRSLQTRTFPVATGNLGRSNPFIAF